MARREHRDLLVVGSGRYAGDGHVSLGERARELMGQLECPLAIARLGMRKPANARLERIGVGFDGGPEAAAALHLARSIALAAGAELQVRGVVDDRVAGGLTIKMVVLEGEAIVANRVSSLLDRALAAARAVGVPGPRGSAPATRPTSCRRWAPALTFWSWARVTSDPPSASRSAARRTTSWTRAPCAVLLVTRPAMLPHLTAFARGGSGFGGSVSALRLSEKGYRVAVLEAGRRFADQDASRRGGRPDA